MYLCETEADSLVQLTQKFVDYLDGLHQDGAITKQQFAEMTRTKLKFLRHMLEKKNYE